MKPAVCVQNNIPDLSISSVNDPSISLESLFFLLNTEEKSAEKKTTLQQFLITTKFVSKTSSKIFPETKFDEKLSFPGTCLQQSEKMLMTTNKCLSVVNTERLSKCKKAPESIEPGRNKEIVPHFQDLFSTLQCWYRITYYLDRAKNLPSASFQILLLKFEVECRHSSFPMK